VGGDVVGRYDIKAVDGGLDVEAVVVRTVSTSAISDTSSSRWATCRGHRLILTGTL
jgi:hypothetical protein